MTVAVRRITRWVGAIVTGLALCIATQLESHIPANAAVKQLTCGSGNPAPYAEIKPRQPSVTIYLGRDSSGPETSPVITFTVSASSCMLPGSIPVFMGVLSGEGFDLGLPRSVPPCRASVIARPFCAVVRRDGDTIDLTLQTERSQIPAGSYSGTLEIGDSHIGESEIAITLERPDQAWPAPILLGIAAVAGGIGFAGIREWFAVSSPAGAAAGAGDGGGGANGGGATTPPVGIAEAPVKRYPKLRRRLAPLWRVVSSPVRFLKKRLTASGALATCFGIGAGAVTWVNTYAYDRAWSLNIGTAFTLLSKVGGAAAASAFVIWTAGAAGHRSAAKRSQQT